MSLTLFNGSPRGPKSNSTVIGQWFQEGYGESCEPIYLSKIKHHREYIVSMDDTSDILFVFPLYVDGMPAQVKSFFELMAEYPERFMGSRVTYIIHSGFSEGIHCENLKAYLERFSELMSMDHQGVVIIPGSEGFRLMPEPMTNKKRALIQALGNSFKKKLPLNEVSLKKLYKRQRLSPFSRVLHIVLSKLGLTNLYWNSMLKQNKAYDKRYDAPYADLKDL